MMHAQQQRGLAGECVNDRVEQGAVIKVEAEACLLIKYGGKFILSRKRDDPARERRVPGVILQRSVLGTCHTDTERFSGLYQPVERAVKQHGVGRVIKGQQYGFCVQCFVRTAFACKPDLVLRPCQRDTVVMNVHKRELSNL